MRFRQLYYTSCKTGLSGYAGFQFNAATPGAGPEVMREIESVSSYEPPASLGHTPTPEQIRDCPVNLCFVPGEVPLLTRVVFTGTDYSGRFGNYFAHSLVPEAPAGPSWPGPPAIELWGAPFWAREEAARQELPALPALPPGGPLTRRAIDAFLDDQGRRRHLAALLSAAERAVLDQERSVVILDHDAERVAQWIAALSYLLPPPVAARMSFTTYQHRPAYSSLHIIGTVPGTDLVPDERAAETFYLFDFTAGRAAGVPVTPAAEQLAEAGTESAERLWARAGALADGTEARLSDWDRILTAMAVLDGRTRTATDLDDVAAWLAGNASRLDSQAVVAPIGAILLEQPGAGSGRLTHVADAAEAAGLGDLLVRTEKALVEACLQGQDGAMRPLRSEAAREHATLLYGRRLNQAGAGEAVPLLRLAERHGVQLDARSLRDFGSRTAGPLVLDGSADPGLREIVAGSSGVREGVLDHLVRSAHTDGGHDRLLRAFESGLDEVFPAAELAAQPELGELALIARARREPGRRVSAALEILAGRRPGTRLGAWLLRTLWPDGWTLPDAVTLLGRLPAEQTDARAVAPLVSSLLNTDLRPDDPATWDAYGALCDLVVGLSLREQLPPGDVDLLRAMRWIRAAEKAESTSRKPREQEGAARELVMGLEKRAGTGKAHEYLYRRLTVLLPGMEPKAVASLLREGGQDARYAYLEGLRLRLAKGGEGAPAAAAAGFVTARIGLRDGQKSLPAEIEKALLDFLPEWRGRELNEVGRQVRDESARLGDDFKRWREQHCRRRWVDALKQFGRG